jgi:hypothetical protein
VIGFWVALDVDQQIDREGTCWILRIPCGLQGVDKGYREPGSAGTLDEV